MIIFAAVLCIATFLMTTSLLYTSVKLGISPMPSSRKAYTTMSRLVDETGTGAIIDLGSGWGTFVIRIAKRHPQRQVIGYELSLLPWLISVLVKKILDLKNLTLYRADFYQVRLPPAAVLVCYLFPAAMYDIEHKLLLDQAKVDFILSNNFALPSSKPYKVLWLNDFFKSPIYLYRINH